MKVKSAFSATRYNIPVLNPERFLALFSSCHIIPSSARGLAGLISVDDADGLRHDTDVVGDGSAHVGLELLGNLTQSVPDASQDFLLLFFGHFIASCCMLIFAVVKSI